MNNILKKCETEGYGKAICFLNGVGRQAWEKAGVSGRCQRCCPSDSSIRCVCVWKEREKGEEKTES